MAQKKFQSTAISATGNVFYVLLKHESRNNDFENSVASRYIMFDVLVIRYQVTIQFIFVASMILVFIVLLNSLCKRTCKSSFAFILFCQMCQGTYQKAEIRLRFVGAKNFTASNCFTSLGNRKTEVGS